MAGGNLKMGEVPLGDRKGDDGGAVARDVILPAGDDGKGLMLVKAGKALRVEHVAQGLDRVEGAGGSADKPDEILNGLLHAVTSIWQNSIPVLYTLMRRGASMTAGGIFRQNCIKEERELHPYAQM